MRYQYRELLEDYVNKLFNENEETIKVPTKSDKLVIACILDEFSFHCFKYEADLVQLGINNFKTLIDNEMPHFLLVEAAWEGLNKQWTNKVSNLKSTNDKYLLELVNYCKVKNIPTVFWAKEDPYDFELFIEAASYFDFVFTTDLDSIDRYKEILKHDNVFLLSFAAQPRLHNPIDKDKEKKGKVAFAGGWYSKFPKRIIDMESILEPSFKYNLTIYDRFQNSKNNKNTFPDKYKPYIKGGLNYLDLVKEYKKYDVMLNVNSTATSPTTFSRRVFEVLASGISIISSYSLGISNYFNDIVRQTNNKVDTTRHLETLLNNPLQRDKLSLLGQRKVFEYHTYKHRLNVILDKIGLDNDIDQDLGVSVITCSNRKDSLNNILDNYKNQTYPKKELIIIINNNDISLQDWMDIVRNREDITIYKLREEVSLGNCLNYAIANSKYDYISKFDDDDYYGPNYLKDSINAFKYTDAAIVGKQTIYSYIERTHSLVLRFPNHENSYTDYVAGSTITFKKEIFSKVKFKNLNQSEDTNFLINALEAGFKIYSLDRFNHVVSRRSNLESHTWKISETNFIKNSIFVAITTDYKPIVTL